MLKQFLLLSIISLCSFFQWVNSQVVFSTNKDTLTYDQRMGGKSDTMDLALNKGTNLLPGTGFNNTYNYSQFYWLYNGALLSSVSSPNLERAFVFSALPHIGFAYSFGSKGCQNLHTIYSQGFKNGGLLNITLERQSSNGFMRNSNYTNSNLWFGYQKDKGLFWTHIRGTYVNDNRTLNGGTTDSTNFLSFGPEFTRIQKSQANSETKRAQFLMENRLNFTGDSSTVHTGLLLQNKFSLNNRVYTEVDSLQNIYSLINIDTLNTRDQFQENILANGAGYFFQSKNFEISGQIFQRYRRLQNLGTTRDTNEISLDGSARFQLCKAEVKAHLYQNFIGAKGESSYQFQVKYRRNKLKLQANAKYSRLLPNLQQRQYFGNNLNYQSLLNIQNTLLITGQTSLKLNDHLEINGEGGYVDRKNVLVWGGYNWVINGLSNDRCVFVKLNPIFTWGVFKLLPFVEYSHGSNYLPSWVEGGRILYQKMVFKQQKLKLSLSADIVHNSSYTTMNYSTLLDVYYQGYLKSNSMTSIHGTFGLSIEEFRFYIRLENINRLGLIEGNQTNYIVNGYFATPFALKVGITWDFFN